VLLSHGLVPDSCGATERNGNSINSYVTDDNIKNNYNGACFNYLWQVFWTFWYCR